MKNHDASSRIGYGVSAGQGAILCKCANVYANMNSSKSFDGILSWQGFFFYMRNHVMRGISFMKMLRLIGFKNRIACY